MDHNCGRALTEGGRPGTASGLLHRRPRVERLTQLLVLAGPGVERDVFSVKQDGALPGGKSLAGIQERAVNHESNIHHLEKRLQLQEFRKVVSSNILSSQYRLAVYTWRNHSQDHCHSNTMDLRATKWGSASSDAGRQRNPVHEGA